MIELFPSFSTRFWTKKKTELLEADKMKMKEELNGNLCPEAGDTKEEEEEEKEEGDSPEIKRIFRPLQSKNQKRSNLKNGDFHNFFFLKQSKRLLN